MFIINEHIFPEPKELVVHFFFFFFVFKTSTLNVNRHKSIDEQFFLRKK